MAANRQRRTNPTTRPAYRPGGFFYDRAMTIQTIERAIMNIAAQTLGIDPQDANAATPIPGSRMQEINDETCLALNINISASRAGQCQTVGQYVELVQEERAKP